jgi:hypothetical protein
MFMTKGAQALRLRVEGTQHFVRSHCSKVHCPETSADRAGDSQNSAALEMIQCTCPRSNLHRLQPTVLSAIPRAGCTVAVPSKLEAELGLGSLG